MTELPAIIDPQAGSIRSDVKLIISGKQQAMNPVIEFVRRPGDGRELIVFITYKAFACCEKQCTVLKLGNPFAIVIRQTPRQNKVFKVNAIPARNTTGGAKPHKAALIFVDVQHLRIDQPVIDTQILMNNNLGR